LLAVPFREVIDLDDSPLPNAPTREEVTLREFLTAALKPEGFNIGFTWARLSPGGSIAQSARHMRAALERR